MSEIKVLLAGCNRNMGELVSRLIDSTSDIKVECGYDTTYYKESTSFPIFENIWNIDLDTDVIIYVSSPCNISNVLEYACKGKGVPIVIGSTGLLDQDIERIRKLCNEIPIFMLSSSNLPIESLANLILVATRFMHTKPAGFYDIHSIPII